MRAGRFRGAHTLRSRGFHLDFAFPGIALIHAAFRATFQERPRFRRSCIKLWTHQCSHPPLQTLSWGPDEPLTSLRVSSASTTTTTRQAWRPVTVLTTISRRRVLRSHSDISKNTRHTLSRTPLPPCVISRFLSAVVPPYISPH